MTVLNTTLESLQAAHANAALRAPRRARLS
jgi:hypothetical protein